MSTKITKEAIVEEFFRQFKSQGEKMLIVKAEDYGTWLLNALTQLETSTIERAIEALPEIGEESELKGPYGTGFHIAIKESESNLRGMLTKKEIMQSEKDKAEQYVREKLPELMEQTFGCYYRIKDPTASEGNKHREHTIYRAFGKIEKFAPENELEILGHPIQLQHWLRVLGALVPIEMYFIEPHQLEVATGELFDTQKVYFNLTTGHPATEADYLAFNQIVNNC